MRPLPLLLGIFVGTIVSASIVSAWTGPSGTAPTGNVAAPINVGIVDQIKNGGLGVNSLAVYGNTILSGTNLYLNFGVTAGTNGYGIRDNAGTLEFKDSAGTWKSLNTVVTTYNTLNGLTQSAGKVSQIKFADGTTQTSAPVSSLPVFTSRYGSGKRCANDAWISACEYQPGLPWNYNVCYSRGHAVSYGWHVVWHPEVLGYQLAGGGYDGWPTDLVCDI